MPSLGHDAGVGEISEGICELGQVIDADGPALGCGIAGQTAAHVLAARDSQPGRVLVNGGDDVIIDITNQHVSYQAPPVTPS